MRYFQWAAPAALMSAFALSACAGGGSSPNPIAPGAGSAAQARHASPQLYFDSAGARSNAVCPKKYLGCDTVSLTNGVVVDWCAGNGSDPCSATRTYTWSGNVCKKKTPSPCAAIAAITGKWTGPFACSPSITRCGTSHGAYVVDTIEASMTKPPKETAKYAYKQDIKLTGLLVGELALNVGP